MGDLRRIGGLCLFVMVMFSGCRGEDRQGGGAVPTVAPSITEPRKQLDAPVFEEVTRQLGIDFLHQAGRPGSYFFPEIMSAGAALLDYDRDGDLDVYLINGNRNHDGSPSAGPEEVNRLYRQEADGSFHDVTAESGLGDTGYGMGVAVGDVNNDGWPDVYVTNFGADRLYLNQQGTFRDITAEAGIDNLRWAASATFVDYDRDGRLDLYVTNYVNYFASRRCPTRDGSLDYCSPSSFDGTLDKLYRNVSGASDPSGGAVRFEDVSAAAGIATRRGPGLGVVACDVDRNGWPDLYVANDGSDNFLWVNQQNGTFREEAIIRGAAYDAQGRSQAGMGIAVGDVNQDQIADLFVTHLAGETNALYVSSEGGSFIESAVARGLGVASYSFTGFGTAFVDLDHDGHPELLVANGRVTRPKSASPAGDSFWSVYAEVNHLFWNDGTNHFQLVESKDDPLLTTAEISRALCVGDLDNDGDMDLLVTNTAGPARIYRNRLANKGHWLMVRAVDPRYGGRDAYGATVEVVAGQHRAWRMVNPGSGYCGSNDPRLHFGLGAADRYDQLQVTWPDGMVEVFPGGTADQLIELVRDQGSRP